MPLPNDPESREWLELSGANPDLVDQFRPALVSFIAADKARFLGSAGTGFFIGFSEGLALLMTARHVLDFVGSMQRPHSRHAASALKMFLPKTDPLSIKHGSVAALWANEMHAQALHIEYASLNDTDVACCLAIPELSSKTSFIPACLQLSTEPPKVGSLIHYVSYLLQEPEEISPLEELPEDAFKLTRSVSVRRGTVIGVHWQGYRQYGWPCITTTIPAEPGMSGGFAYLVGEHGTPLGVCGIICADNSSVEARKSPFLAGESVVAMSVLALGLQIPIQTTDTSPRRTLQEMMRAGDFPSPIGGFEQFKITLAD